MEYLHSQVGRIVGSAEDERGRQLKALARGPLYGAKTYTGYKANGFIFHTKERSVMRSFDNSGVLCKADTTCYASTSDNNPIEGAIDYYGVLREVVELQYLGHLSVVLFKCDWYNVLSSFNGMKIDEYGFVCVNTKFFFIKR